MRAFIRIIILSLAAATAVAAGIAVVLAIGLARGPEADVSVGASSAAPVGTASPTEAEPGDGGEAAEQFLRELTGSTCSGGADITIGIEPGLLERARSLGPTANTWISGTFWVGDRDAALATLDGEVIDATDAEAWVLMDGEHGPFALQLQKVSSDGTSLWAKANRVTSLDPSACQ